MNLRQITLGTILALSSVGRLPIPIDPPLLQDAAAVAGAPATKAAAWPQPWGRWQQAWRQRGVGSGGSAVRVRVRSYSIFNMSDIDILMGKTGKYTHSSIFIPYVTSIFV